MGVNTEVCPDPSRRGTLGGDEPDSQGPSAGGAQAGRFESQDQSDPRRQDQTVGLNTNPPPRTEVKSSPLKRAVRKLKSKQVLTL